MGFVMAKQKQQGIKMDCNQNTRFKFFLRVVGRENLNLDVFKIVSVAKLLVELLKERANEFL
jgi:hypothetical protein